MKLTTTEKCVLDTHTAKIVINHIWKRHIKAISMFAKRKFQFHDFAKTEIKHKEIKLIEQNMTKFLSKQR